MIISRLIVRVDGQEECPADFSDRHHDVIQLMQMAESIVFTAEITVNGKASIVLERMRKIDRVENLCLRLEDLDLSVRSANMLQNAGFIYVWEVVELEEKQLVKRLRGVRRWGGSVNVREIKATLEEDLNLYLGMDLNPFMSLLPGKN